MHRAWLRTYPTDSGERVPLELVTDPKGDDRVQEVVILTAHDYSSLVAERDYYQALCAGYAEFKDELEAKMKEKRNAKA